MVMMMCSLSYLEGGHGDRAAVGSGGQEGRGGLRTGVVVRGALSARPADATDCRGHNEVKRIGVLSVFFMLNKF